MDFYTERYGKARPMTKKELERHYEIIDKQNNEIEQLGTIWKDKQNEPKNLL